MSKKYKNPPILEVVCEFRFTLDTEWDITVPGLLYEKIKNDFPFKERRSVQEIEFTHEGQQLKQEVKSDERAVFLNKNRNKLIQVGNHLLTINCLKPYSSWQNFKPKIEQALQNLSEIVEIKGIQRIGLRYINKIEIPYEQIDIENYFEFRPYLGTNLPQKTVEFLVGTTFPFEKDRDSCRLILKNAVPDNPKQSAFILDIDYFLSQQRSIKPDEGLEWVETAHNHVESVFEGCLTDKLRKLFGEEK